MHNKYNNIFLVEVAVIDSINDLSKINDLKAFQLTKVPKEKRTQNASSYSTGADRAIMHVCR
jgi:hypothetical protein